MSASTITAFTPIAELSLATPGLFNSRFQVLQDNIVSVNSGVISPSVLSQTTYAVITLVASSNSSSYIRLVDSSAQRSSYRIGSFDGGTDDGLNIWDESGSTMIVSFSKQSVRFYQNVVGPVFDTGGQFTDTLNAATFGTGVDSKESRVQAAILAAADQGVSRVYVPASLLSYSAASVSFDTRVQMVREGGDWSVDDIRAYGASGVAGISAASAAQAMVNRAYEGGVAYIPPGIYTLGDSGISVTRRIRMVGGGMSATTLTYTGATAAVLVRESTTDGTILEGFSIDGLSNENPSVVGLSLMSNQNCVVRQVAVTGMRGGGSSATRGKGFQILPDAGGARGFFNLFDTCRSFVNGFGFALDNNGSGVASANIILNPDVISCDSVGILVSGSITFGVTIIGGACQNNGGDGIRIEGFHHSVIGTDSEQNGGYGIQNLTGTAKLHLNAGSLDGNTAGSMAGVSIDNSVTAFYPGIERVDIGPHLSVGTLSVGSTSSAGGRLTVTGDAQVTGQVKASSASINMVVNDIRFGSDSYTSSSQFAIINDRGDANALVRILTNEGSGLQERVKFSGLGVGAQGGFSHAPTFNFGLGSEASLGWYRSGASTMALSYGTLLANGEIWSTSGVSARGSIASFSQVSSSRTVRTAELWTSGVSVAASSVLSLAQSRVISMRTLAASAVTTQAANTNVRADEIVFTVGGASGASLVIHSGGTAYIFNSALSARAT